MATQSLTAHRSSSLDQSAAPPVIRSQHDEPPGPVRRHDFQRICDACCAIFAAHIVIDSYLFLRPGTSPGDHLVSGTVPLVVLAGLALLTRRLRAGFVALTAWLLGLAVAIGAAGAPVSGLLAGHVDPTTISGLMALIAGITLIGVGATTLWTTRHSGGTRWRRYLRRGAQTALAAMLAMLIAMPVGMAYFITNRSATPHASIDLGQPHLEIALGTDDGLTLAAAYVPSRNRAAVIVFPGLHGDQTTSRARLLARHGYGVLVLDPRGYGTSEGDPNLLGWTGEPDLVTAIDYLARRPDVDPDRIGGLGLSVGGELMLQTAAHDQRLQAVVSEGAGSRSLAEDIHMRAPDVFLGLPFSIVNTVSTAVFSDSTPPPALHDLVDDIAPRPILLIWTRNGNGETYFDPAYYDLAGEPKEIWEVPESSHIDGLATRPAEYERRVTDFFDQALLHQP